MQAEVRSLAKQIAQIRQTRDKLHQTNTHINAIKAQNNSMVSSVIAIETLGVAGKALGAMNKVTFLLHDLERI